MSRSTTWWIGVLAVVAAAGLAVAGTIAMRPPAPVGSPVPSANPTAPIVARLSIPRVGDCGDHRHGTVTPVVCSDAGADVVVAERLVLGDPQMLCPLFDRASVLATPAGESFTVCWVPVGGGPERRFGPATVRGAATSEPNLPVGTCGDVHDQHVHAPRACDDPSADGVVIMVLEAKDEPASCPASTLLATADPAGGWSCWGPDPA